MSTGKFKDLLFKGDLTFFICVAVVIILPVYVHYLPPLMILWGIFWLWENRFRMNKEMFAGNEAGILFILFILFYLWQIAGLLQADSLNSGFERIFKRLSFFLFPLVLFYPKEKIIKNIHLIIRLFAISTFLFLVFCIINALYNSLLLQDGTLVFNPHPKDYDYENYFYSSRLAFPVHPSYLSMYAILSVLISLEAFFDKSLTRLKRVLWVILTLVLIIAIYLLSSRAGFLALALLVPAYIMYRLYNRFPKWILYSLLVVAVIAFIFIARTNDRIKNSIDGVSRERFNDTFKNDARLMIWRSALGVIKHNYILGVGTGDASAELKKEFMKRGYTEGFYENLNAHNQFLEVLLENGIAGLLFFLGILGYMLFLALSERNLLYCLFVIIMIIFFFFETVLNRIAGITFFSLFSFLLIHISLRRKR